jgi:uncharacterized membrane protein YoaK (UPF0700 family)
MSPTVVVVGNVTKQGFQIGSHVNALAVQSSFILINNLLPLYGVPVGAAIVAAVDKAVTLYWSVVSLLIVIVAALAVAFNLSIKAL